MPEHSVWVKVGLYTFDVGSDWVNGGLMLQCSVNSTTNETFPSPRATSSEELAGCEPWWGSLTIAMSWIPPTLFFLMGAFGAIQRIIVDGRKAIPSACELCLVTLIFPLLYALWPILVPIGM